MIEIRRFFTNQGSCPFDEWAAKMDPKTRTRVVSRIQRVQLGNFGDAKPLHTQPKGLYELRLQFGAGYRVYFGRQGDRVVILLCGGG